MKERYESENKDRKLDFSAINDYMKELFRKK
jgi:hypothetical protein